MEMPRVRSWLSPGFFFFFLLKYLKKFHNEMSEVERERESKKGQKSEVERVLTIF
jgi:hypothetical protein